MKPANLITPALSVEALGFAPPAPGAYRVSFSFSRHGKLHRFGTMGPSRALPPTTRTTMRRIALEVAERHGLTVEQLRGPQRHRTVAWPRQELMYELYATGRFSSTQIGIFLGERDHTTVLHGCRRHAERNGLPHIAKAAEVRA